VVASLTQSTYVKAKHMTANSQADLATGAQVTQKRTGAAVNILIVDDEPRNLTVLETILDSADYRLVRAGSGEQALLSLMKEEFALLVLDIRMPGMTGLELAKMIKERKKTASIPIIFLTAYYNEDQHVLEGYDSGAVDYLHKPVNAAVLRSKVAVFADLYRKTLDLQSANAALMNEINERRVAEDRIVKLNESLEHRVAQRTSALRSIEGELREANVRKDEFLATLAHELRNPLAPVRSAVEVLLRKGAHAPEVKWACGIVDRQLQTMTRIIDDLMDVSRINQGKIELRLELVSLAEVLRSAVESCRSLIEGSGHKFTFVIPSETTVVEADRIRMAQVFINLLNNAAKYTDRGGSIEMTTQLREDCVVVSVKDTGIGIAPDKLSSVFEMFSQVEAALTRSRGGLGIGLALTKRLAEMQGGKVEARSDGIGRGSEFLVRLPIASKGGADTSEAELATVDPGTLPCNGLRILLADDNRDAAETMAMLLEFGGHDVEFVHDGAQAVRAAAEHCPQVVILDVGMPILNGLDACRQIRALPGGQDITMIAVTGWGQLEDRRRTREAGFDHHLTKPAHGPTLLTILAGLEKKSEGQAALGQDLDSLGDN
jgi:signal transduction histidine kinase